MDALNNHELESYEPEVQKKWGKTDAYIEYADRAKKYSVQQFNDLAQELDRIMESFASCKICGCEPESDNAQQLVVTLQSHITNNYYHCTNQILAGLGQMYISDERFRKNIDKHADGTAAYINRAICCYCNK